MWWSVLLAGSVTVLIGALFVRLLVWREAQESVPPDFPIAKARDKGQDEDER